jgi:hypothetical protein
MPRNFFFQPIFHIFAVLLLRFFIPTAFNDQNCAAYLGGKKIKFEKSFFFFKIKKRPVYREKPVQGYVRSSSSSKGGYRKIKIDPCVCTCVCLFVLFLGLLPPEREEEDGHHHPWRI